MNKILPVSLLLLVVAGCGLFGPNPSGPSKAEGYFFNVQTNYIPIMVLQTNTTFLTNTVVQIQTNLIGQVVLFTNQITLPAYNLITVTQQIPEYLWTPKTNSIQLAQTAGTIGNIALPGSGGLITGLITAGLLAWGKLRSSKKTNVNLAQGTETLLELLQMLPDGDKHVLAAKQMLQKSQAQDGVSQQVQTVLSNDVSRGDAKASATEIQSNVARSKS